MALNGEDEILLVHAASVVDHADQFAAAILDRHVDALGAGVERVFDQLLDGGAWPLDHFAGGDAVDEDGIETANGHERFFLRSVTIIQRECRASLRDFAHPNLLFFGNPRGGRRPASARWPSQSFSSGLATLKTRPEESVQLKPSFIANTLASETPPSL